MCVVVTFSKLGINQGMVANPACGQLKRENGVFPVPVRAREFVSGVRFGCPAPRQPAHGTVGVCVKEGNLLMPEFLSAPILQSRFCTGHSSVKETKTQY